MIQTTSWYPAACCIQLFFPILDWRLEFPFISKSNALYRTMDVFPASNEISISLTFSNLTMSCSLSAILPIEAVIGYWPSRAFSALILPYFWISRNSEQLKGNLIKCLLATGKSSCTVLNTLPCLQGE